MYFVNEDGLYDVILDSRKPEAKKFRKWVTSEVLPSIRKHGVYATGDLILQCPDLVPTSQIAKDYGYSVKKFDKLLHELGVQFKQGGVWLLYQKYAAQGWSQTRTHKYMGADGVVYCKVHTYWTPKGRLGLHKLLKQNGYLPLIEQAA